MRMNNLKIFLIENWYPQKRTDGDLATALGVDKTLVSKWLAGIIEPPLERKIQVAKLLGVDSRYLFPENDRSRKNDN